MSLLHETDTRCVTFDITIDISIYHRAQPASCLIFSTTAREEENFYTQKNIKFDKNMKNACGCGGDVGSRMKNASQTKLHFRKGGGATAQDP